MRSICIVCDPDPVFAGNLVDYLKDRKRMPFDVQAFTDVEKLRQFAESAHVELLLIAADQMSGEMCQALKGAGVGCICLLSEEESGEVWGCPVILKYQSGDTLAAQVMNIYASRSGESMQNMRQEGDDGETARMIGVCSPLGRCGKTMLAIALGQALARTEKVLYLNLENYHGFTQLCRTESWQGDLSDLLYYSRNHEDNLVFRINALVCSWKELDYIPPPFSSYDLRDLPGDEWICFLRQIAGCEAYDTLILDLGNQIEEIFHILRICSRVYVPVLDDVFSRAKLRQFEDNLSALEYRGLKEKIRRVSVPRWQGKGNLRDFPAGLTDSPVGELAERLVREEKWRE